MLAAVERAKHADGGKGVDAGPAEPPTNSDADADLDRRRALLALAALTAVTLALRAGFAATVELSPDEAYYAAWSRRLDSSYLDHPPLVAWLMAAGSALFGGSELGVRAPGLLLGAALPWLLYGASRALCATRRGSLWSTFLASSTLLFSAGAVIVTPDTPLCLAFALAILCVAKSLGTAPPSSGAGRAWLMSAGAGVALAAAFASKATTVLFWGAALAQTGLGPWRRRARWLLLALAGLVPVLLWNAEHGWPMFTFHAARVSGRAAFAPNFAGEFLAAQVALLCVGPAILVGMASWWAVRRGGAAARAFAWWGLGPLAATLLLAMFTKVEANWIAPAFLPLFAVLAVWLDSARPRVRTRTLATVTVVSALLTLVAHLHVVSPFLPLPEARDPSAQLRGGRALAAAVAEERAGLPVLTSRYQEASLLSFYLRDATVTTLLGGRRKSQFDFWPAPTREAPRALCVHVEGEAPPAGRRVVIGPTAYFLHVCTPARWSASLF